MRVIRKINEASKRKLLNYIGKAVSSYGDARHDLKWGQPDYKEQSKKAVKRYVGISQAADKVAGKNTRVKATNEAVGILAKRVRYTKAPSTTTGAQGTDFTAPSAKKTVLAKIHKYTKAPTTTKGAQATNEAVGILSKRVKYTKAPTTTTSVQGTDFTAPSAKKTVLANIHKYTKAPETPRKSGVKVVSAKTGKPVSEEVASIINEISQKLKKSYFDKAEKSNTAVGYGFPMKKYGNNPEYNKADKRSRIMSKVRTDIKDNTPLEHEPKVHDLRDMSHGEVYDHTQTHDGVKDGDVLHVKGGAAVMMQAWPVMVHGETDGKSLHKLKSGGSFPPRYDASVKKAQELKEDTILEMSDGKIRQYIGKALGDTKRKRTKSINLAADKIEKKAKVPATLNEGLRLIKTYENDGHVAKVYKDNEWNEHRVKYYPKDGKHKESQDYHTDDAEDAHDTAQHELKRMAGKKKG